MATWTNIANTSLEPGSPARSVDAFALRDNPIAIAEGAAGAPRIAGQSGPAVQTAGLFDSAVTTAKIANDAVDTAKIITPTGGNSFIHAKINEFAQTSLNSFQSIGGVAGFLFTGIYSVTVELRTPQSSDTGILRVLKNGAFAFDLASNSGAYVTLTGSISCDPFDRLTFQIRCANVNNDRLVQIQDLRITAGNQSFGGYRAS